MMSTHLTPAGSAPIQFALLVYDSVKNKNAGKLPKKTEKNIFFTIYITHNDIKTEEINSQLEKRNVSSTIMGALNKARHSGCTHALILKAKNKKLLESFFTSIQNIENYPDTLWIGNRNSLEKNGGNIRRQISFMDKITNLWYRLLTGIRFQDTLCPLRVYPIQKILELQCKKTGYAWEQTVLVVAAWNGIPIREFTMDAPAKVKDSFARQTKDFFCTLKVFTGLTVKKIVLPLEILSLPGTSWQQQIIVFVKHEMRANTTPNKAAGSVALGVCMGLSPFHGFQMVLLLAISYVFHLNRPLAILGVNISCAPLIPFIIATELALGKVLVPADLTLIISGSSMAQGFAAFFVGSCILSIVGGGVTFFLTKPLFTRWFNQRSGKPKANS